MAASRRARRGRARRGARQRRTARRRIRVDGHVDRRSEVVTAIRSRGGGSTSRLANGRSGGGAHHGSPGSYPARTSRNAAASSTVRASGPAVESPSSEPKGALDTRPRDGFSPKRPQHDAGIRIEPPPSVAWAIGTRPAATAAAAPPLEPPGVRSVFHGLRVAPLRSDSVNATVPNSGVFVLPTITKPASRIRRTTAVSKSGT